MTHKPITQNAWIRQPLALLCAEGGISKPAAIILALIIDRATDTEPPRPVQVDVDQLAWASGYSSRTVRRALDELTRRELLAITHTGRASLYTLTGAVELLPPKRQPAPRSTTRSGKPSGLVAAASDREARELAEYAALSNRFAPEAELIPADLGVCSTPAPATGEGYEL